MQKTLVIIGGPTAVGKTAVSIKLAENFATEIISADSRQFYKEMNIGTAKPSPPDLQQIPHHFINSHSIKEELTAGDFSREGRALLARLFIKKDLIIVTGGSGLYIDSLVNGVANIPKPDPAIREKLNEDYKKNGLEHLLIQLRKLDPTYFQEVDQNNPQRVIRALEMILTTGKPFSFFRDLPRDPLPYKVVSVGLQLDRAVLYDRINARVLQMVEDGLFEEVSGLVKYRGLNALQTVGYKEVFSFIDGEITKDEAIELIQRNTRRYAKRQLTWFGKYENMTWFDPNDLIGIDTFVRESVGLNRLY